MLSLSLHLFFFFYLLFALSKVLKAVGESFKRHTSLESSDSKGAKRTRRGNTGTRRKCQKRRYLHRQRPSTTSDKAGTRKLDPEARCLTPIRCSDSKRVNGTCQATTNAGKACRNRVKQTKYCHAHSHLSKLVGNLPHQPPPSKQTTGVQRTWEKLWVPGVNRRGKYILCDGTSFFRVNLSIIDWLRPDLTPAGRQKLLDCMRTPLSQGEESGYIYAYKLWGPSSPNCVLTN